MRYIVHEMDLRVLDAMCRIDFASFGRECFHTISPGSQFRMNWHIRAIAYVLEQVRLGKIKRLIIVAPPRSLKSLMSSVAWAAFILGHDPTKSVAVISYGSDLAAKLGNDFRQIINAPWYQRQFPLCRISPIKNTEFEVRTTQNGSRLGTTIDGTFTGLGADIIVIDDPLKSIDATSKPRREKVNYWFNNTLKTRLNDPRTGAIVVVMQRLHEDDLPGMLLRSSEAWTVLTLPAIAEHEEYIQISDNQFHLRRIGDSLHPDRQTPEELHQLRAQVGPETFAAHYQQAPLPAAGAMIEREWFRYYDELPRDVLSAPIIQSWDVASKDGELNDWSVCTTWRYHMEKYYLVDLLRVRFAYSTLKDHAIGHGRQHRANEILIEDAGLGTALVDEMKKAGLPATGVRPQLSKKMRVSIQSVKFRNGAVLFQRHAPYLLDLEGELLAFPNGRYDDQVDSVMLALSYDRPTYDLARMNAGMQELISALAFQRMFGG
jgi:predicted phage terminase large subunit-like protein